MNPQMSALFAQHKTAVLAAGGALVVGLALMQRKKNAATTTSTTAGALVPATATTIPGTIPASAVVPGGYDSSSYDTYNALQPELSAILAQEQMSTGSSSGITTAPAPVASTLFAPTSSTDYVTWANGEADQVQSDGSLLHLSPQQYAQAVSSGATFQRLPQASPSQIYSTGGNLAAVNKGAGS